MKLTPRDFQRYDLDRLKAHNYRALLNQETGSGKTVTSVLAHVESGSDVTLVIAPDQTHRSAWIPTLEAVGVEGRIIGNSNKSTKVAYQDFLLGFPGVYITTPQWFTRTDSSEWSGDLLLIDESHGLMAPQSRGQRALSGYTAKETSEALVQRFDGRMSLSGTALRNRFELAWSQGRTLWPELNKRGQIAHDNHYAWLIDRMNYTEVYTGKRDQWGAPKKARKYYGETVPGRWISEVPLAITHYKRRRCCEFHPDGFLPMAEPTVVHETITLAPAQKKAVKELEASMMTYLGENALVCDIPLTKATRVRQMTLGVPTMTYDDAGVEEVTFEDDCVSPYLDWLMGFLDESDETVLVLTDSQRFAKVTTNRLNAAGISAFEYSGATRGTRANDAALFGTKYRVLVGVLAALAEGFDGLQSVCKTEVWLNTSLDGTINTQMEGRLDRIGQKDQIMRIYLHDDLGLSEGRFSEAVEKRLQLNRSLRVATPAHT